MKKILLTIAVLFVTIASFAQNGARKTPEERAEMFMKGLNKEVTLTADQSSKIQIIQMDGIKKIEEIRAKMTENSDRKAMRQEVIAINDATETKIKAVLTDEQKIKFDAWQDKKKEEMKNRQDGGGRNNN